MTPVAVRPPKMAKKKKPGGTTRTDMNRRLGEVLKELILNRKATERLASVGGGGGGRTTGGGAAAAPIDVSFLALESTQSTLATEATLLLVQIDTGVIRSNTTAIANSVVQIDSNTDPTGGLTIAEWLEDIEADVDGLEGRLDTLIANNTADFILNVAEMGVQAALVIAAIVAQTAAQLITSTLQTASITGALSDVEDEIVITNTLLAEAGGLTIAEWLEDIEADVDGIEGKLDSIIGLLEDLTFTDADVFSFTISPATQKKYRVQPDSSDSTCHLISVQIKNADPVFPITFRFYLRNNSGVLSQLFEHITIISALQTVSVRLDLDIRRKCHLEVEASISSSHVYVMAYLNEGTVTFSDAA